MAFAFDNNAYHFFAFHTDATVGGWTVRAESAEAWVNRAADADIWTQRTFDSESWTVRLP